MFVSCQLALSSFYEQGDQDVGIDEDIDETSATPVTDTASSRPIQAPTSLFGHHDHDQDDESAKGKAKKDKSKNKYNVGGARIVTLNNMSSDDEDDDESSGQVSDRKFAMKRRKFTRHF